MSAPFIPAILSDLQDLGITPYIEIGTQDLAALNNGGKSANSYAMSTALAGWLNQDAGRHVLVAPLPEMNLGEHPLGTEPIRLQGWVPTHPQRIARQGSDAKTDPVRFLAEWDRR